MKCDDARHWLLTGRSDAPPPAALERHLQRCARCRRQREQIKRLDAKTGTLAAPPAPADARRRLNARLERTPQQPPRRAPRWGVPWQRIAAYAAAAAVLLTVGCLVGRMTTAPNEQVVQGPPTLPTRVPAVTDRIAVLPRLVEQDVKLAAATTPAEQMTHLAGLADVLRGEALRLAKDGPREELPVVADLYSRVLRQGVLGRARVIPKEQRPVQVAQLAADLRSGRDQLLAAARGSEPIVSDCLSSLGAAALETGQALHDPPAAASASAPPPAPSLLAAVVLAGLRLGESSDALTRAEVCSELAEQLAQALPLLPTDAKTEPLAPLGDQLSALIEKGVGDNLDVAAKTPATPTAPKVEQVRSRRDRACATLRRNLERLRGPAWGSLRRALEARGKDWGHFHHGHSKGPKGGPIGFPGKHRNGEADQPVNGPSKGSKSRSWFPGFPKKHGARRDNTTRSWAAPNGNYLNEKGLRTRGITGRAAQVSAVGAFH